MKPSKTVKATSLYPQMDSAQSVVELALSQHPITCPNQLISLLQTMRNTALAETKEKK